MENKINIAELLKDCPKGMELDCTTWENVTFEKVRDDNIFIRRNNKQPQHDSIVVLNEYGCATNHKDEKCRIFPKGKTTWEGFQRPFKDGDIVTWEDRGSLVAFIYKERKDVAVVKHHFALYKGSLGTVTDGEISLVENKIVFATEEEKQKLFKAIKDNGYRWNSETKTLERLIEPKFKIGDKIMHKIHRHNPFVITEITEQSYKGGTQYEILIEQQDNFELFSNKFNIATLKPFESRVLVRDKNTDKWKSTFWGFYDIDNAMNYPYECCGNSFAQCIPYKGNEYLLGKTDDCNNYYKTWGK